jgi:hypothetical protein
MFVGEEEYCDKMCQSNQARSFSARCRSRPNSAAGAMIGSKALKERCPVVALRVIRRDTPFLVALGSKSGQTSILATPVMT